MGGSFQGGDKGCGAVGIALYKGRCAGHMLSLRLLADSDMVRYRKCGALSNAHKSAPMQTYVKDMSASPLFANAAAAILWLSV